jgi:exosome complex component RRP41
MQDHEIFELAGLRIDGRRFDEIRPMDCRLGFISHVDGSAYLEHGLNKVLAMIVGPHEPKRKGDAALNDECVIECQILHAPFSRSQRKKRRQGDRRVCEQESVVEQTIRSAVISDLYLKSQISIVVHVLEADGSILSTILNAVFLAMMQGGIAMYDMLTACTVGYIRGKLVLDMNQTEIAAGGAFFPIVVKAKTDEIVFIQLDSTLSFELLEEAMTQGVKGCKQIRNYQEGVMKQFMQAQKDRQSKK